MNNILNKPPDAPIFCYECRSRDSFKVNDDYPLKNYQTEWVCRICGHKTWRPVIKVKEGGK